LFHYLLCPLNFAPEQAEKLSHLLDKSKGEKESGVSPKMDGKCFSIEAIRELRLI
jgi:hypothetical protein